jgi:calcineurin-like phosphoesterase family protein
MIKRADFFIADTHLGHKNIINFESRFREGKLRDFATIEEHDEFLIKNWNNTVGVNDKVYLVGDVAFSSRQDLLARLSGSIVIVLGNHDYMNKIPAMLEHEHVKVCGSVEYKGGIISHIPVHTSQLERWDFNIHGHLHEDVVEDDGRYICVSAEHTDFTPISWEDLNRRHSIKG